MRRRLVGTKGSVSPVKSVLQHLASPVLSPFRPAHSDNQSFPLWLAWLAVAISSTNVAFAEGEPNRPYIRRSEVAMHRTKETGIWVMYKEGVYDVTSFVNNHPGGKDKIMLAAGDDIEPFWNVYRQHYNSSLPKELLQGMKIGNLHPDDLAALNAERSKSQGSADDPYSKDP
eukprot:gene27692-33446_t